MKQVSTALQDEEGTDLRTGRAWKATNEYFETENWWDEFGSAVEQVRSKGGSAIQIDSSLQVVVLDLRQDPEKKDLLFAKFLIHSFLVGSAGEIDDPIGTAARVKERRYPVRDLAASPYTGEFAAPWLLPHPDLELVFDLVFGRIKVLMHLDPPGLIEKSKSMGGALRWATRKERALASELAGTSDLDVFRGRRLVAAAGPGNLGPGIVARFQCGCGAHLELNQYHRCCRLRSPSATSVPTGRERAEAGGSISVGNGEEPGPVARVTRLPPLPGQAPRVRAPPPAEWPAFISRLLPNWPDSLGRSPLQAEEGRPCLFGSGSDS